MQFNSEQIKQALEQKEKEETYCQKELDLDRRCKVQCDNCKLIDEDDFD